MDWLPLISEKQLMDIDLLSEQENIKAVVIFKHSTRCGVSSMALDRLERKWDQPAGEVPVYFLDLLKFRDLSHKIAEKYGVRHESPQVLLIKNGKCIYHTSHSGITVPAIQEALS